MDDTGWRVANFTYNFSATPAAWEYIWQRPGDMTPERMNVLGKDGWELCGNLGNDWLIFKRMLPAEALEGTE